MEKQVLNIEQMNNLEGLGLDISDASMMWMDDGTGNFVVGFKNVSYDECLDTPAYTIADIWKKLRTVIINRQNFRDYNLRSNLHTFIGYYTADGEDTLSEFISSDGDMLKISYEMLVWCLKNNYLEEWRKKIN